MSELNELLARIEAADGPDRRLDCDLYIVLEKNESPKDYRLNHTFLEHMPKFTQSIDAALDLCDRVYPRGDWQWCKACEGTLIYGSTPHDVLAADGKGANVALAICAATLKARIAETEGAGATPNSPLSVNGTRNS